MNDLESVNGLARPVLFAGVGNTLKGDDGIGPVIAGRLAAAGVAAVDCGEVPENYLGRILAHPSGSIVFIDAADMRQAPGTVRLFSAGEIETIGMFTHGMSLSMLAEFIQRETRLPVYLLGIQPKSLSLGDPVSPEVEKAAEKVVELLLPR